MRDQIDDRLWAEHGHLFATQVAELLKATLSGFCRLTAISFAAPWRPASAGKC